MKRPADTPSSNSVFKSEAHLAGLSDVEVVARIERYGFNELPSSKPRSIFKIALEVVREPMLLLLLACGSTYLVLGDVQEAVILLIFVAVVITITLYQERKTERALEALRDLSSPGSSEGREPSWPTLRIYRHADTISRGSRSSGRPFRSRGRAGRR